ncbi:CBS domain-containing protein CBSX6 [Acorus gramineus]|uniref:CBS domain-containing protein CBSX6 n=1 Tax=Acorus gramineus TaxID=55184 RepID=A0AAV9B7H4_ACOGR|nr:CBS domain-containing protein CBSX6 [Acorus gramineus]
MASVLLYHVVGDLTVGKPELSEFLETWTVESAMKAIGGTTEGGLPVWKPRTASAAAEVEERAEGLARRFVGIVDSMDIVSFLARAGDHDKALAAPISAVVRPNGSLLKVVDPGTRLIDTLEMMKQGVRRLLVRKNLAWKGMSKRFSILYNGKWLKNLDTSASNNAITTTATSSDNNKPSSSSFHGNKFCCLSREDVLRFLIGCLGALAPIPLSSISSLGVINPHYSLIDASAPAIEATQNRPEDPCAVAVVESTPDDTLKIIGEISASKLWKCDYLGASWALANLSAGQFVMGVEDNTTTGIVPEFSMSSDSSTGVGVIRARKFSSRSIGFFSNQAGLRFGSGFVGGSMYRGRTAPLTCKENSSLAAVMAQVLSHRATHVWVTDSRTEDTLIGVIGYNDILAAVTKHPNSVAMP